jgi:hypothetical protein
MGGSLSGIPRTGAHCPQCDIGEIPARFLQALVELLRPFTKQNDQLSVGIKISCWIGIRK